MIIILRLNCSGDPMAKRKDPNRIGDISELKACAWLLDKEYEVFRNVGCTGPTGEYYERM